MELLLIAACAWLAYTSGAQSEQAKLGVSPAQRDHMREQTRHEKAVRKIAEMHGGATVPPTESVSSPADASTVRDPGHAVSGTFGSGYRSRRPARPPLGARAGEWTGKGVTWAQNTGRDAWQAYRKRRKDAGHDDPGPVLVPIPPARPPDVPPIPADPPTAGPEKGEGGATPEPAAGAPPAIPAEVPPRPSEAPKVAPEKTRPIDVEKRPEPEPDKAPDTPIDPAAADTAEPPKPKPEEATPASPGETPRPDTTPPVDTTRGVGRMASEVSYESVMDESDELSAMCDDDLHTYARIKKRAEREVGRGDTLAAQVLSTGFGATIHAVVVRCREQYQIIHDAIDDLKANTVAQHEAVVVAKDLLQRGQGVYADIARDMEDVAEREAYVSDAVDAEDVNPEAEHYETKAVA